MAKRVLITGVQGFTGRYLAAELHNAGYEVFGLANLKSLAAELPYIKSNYICDLCDAQGLAQVMTAIRPHMVVHLAAIAFVAHGDVDAIYRTNLLGSRNLLEALLPIADDLQSVLIASSANIYGNATGGVLDELTKPDPANDYAVSKLAMEYIAKLYEKRLPLVIVRPFNYTGIGQSDQFLLPKIVNHVRRAASVIELGNLDVARDFSDVRIVTQYYRRLLESSVTPGEIFNVCSGQATTLKEVIDMVRALVSYDFEVRVNPAFVRANEIKILSGSCAKLESTVGKLSPIPLIDTLRWMIESKI